MCCLTAFEFQRKEGHPRIVNLMGGELTVESELGHGTTFEFRVRLERAVCGKGGQGHLDCLLTAIKDKRVLVAENNATSRRLMRTKMESWGTVSEEVADGTRCLELLRKAQEQGRPFHIVLLDAQMSGIDGLTLEKTIRGDSSCGDPAILLLTALGGSPSSGESTEVCCSPSLTKPVRQSALVEALTKILVAPQRANRESGTLARAAQDPIDARILLVEDNPVNVKLARLFMERFGCDVVVADNGQHALDLLGTDSPDLVFMDLQMPIMGGLEATRLIREGEKRTGGHVPIVAMTAHAMDEDRDRCIAAGMDDYVTKPIRAAILRDMIQKWACSPEEHTLRP